MDTCRGVKMFIKINKPSQRPFLNITTGHLNVLATICWCQVKYDNSARRKLIRYFIASWFIIKDVCFCF